MNSSLKPHLVSFGLCPYVRRSVIMLLEKKVDFTISYIDLNNKPSWFLSKSPLGLVPILEVGDTVIFESAVINEYLDEVYQPSMHPKDPLKKARHRGLIELGSVLLGDLYVLCTTGDRVVFEQRRQAVLAKLERFEQECRFPFFDGDALCLVDMALAPALHHMALLQRHFALDLLSPFPRASAWTQALLARDSLRNSVTPQFETDWLASYSKPDHLLTRPADWPAR